MRVILVPGRLTGTLEGVVPAAEAHALITTFGMIAMGVAGISGAFLTVFVAPARVLGWFLGLAMAELLITLTVILLIARRERVSSRHGGEPAGEDERGEPAGRLR
jgi:hypothetical protein